jgi:hypothetical protein
MNTRRSFFKTAASFVAGCALGIGFLKEEKFIENPEYINLENGDGENYYEIHFFLSEDAFKIINIGPPPNTTT